MYGSKGNGGSSFKTAEDAKLVLIFGSSPTETRQGGLTLSLIHIFGAATAQRNRG